MHNSIISPPTQVTSAYIDGLCDVVPNLKRTESDFLLLLHCLKHMPKECTPFKGKILQHLKVHALGNPNANFRLLSSCFARAAILFRKTPNKSEGAIGAWKTSLLSELRLLEENVGELYKTAGITTNYIVERENNSGDDDILRSKGKLSETKSDFESIINEFMLKTHLAACNICALISVQTEFDLPIPVIVILRMAAKVGLLRWNDYKRKPDGLLRNHVYSLSPYLIEIQLMMFRTIVTVLGTNMIPFTQFINQSLLSILEWTRTSNLLKHDESLYHLLRSQLFKMISFLIEQLSLNINLEPKLLKSLLEDEIVDNLDELATQPPSMLGDKHVVDALKCGEDLLTIYNDLLDAPLMCKVKFHLIHTCIEIYRDFPSNNIGPACRKQLLHLLQIVANQPEATSTTETAHNIFQLAYRMESDLGIKQFAHRMLDAGFAHQPIIVTQQDVYSRQTDQVHMSSLQIDPSQFSIESSLVVVTEPPAAVAESASKSAELIADNPEPTSADVDPTSTDVGPATSPDTEPASADVELPFVDASPNPAANIEPTFTEARPNPLAADPVPTIAKPAGDEDEGDEKDISCYMDLFVEKPRV